MESAREDELVIKEILRGSGDGYEFLVNKYQTKIRRYCMNMLSDTADAEDAAQEALVKAYRSLATFRGQSSFSTWLYRISANHCKDVLRKRKVKNELSWESLSRADKENLELLFSHGHDTSLKMEQRETITKLLSILPIEQREVFILREVDGLDYEAIAQILGCTLDSVKGRLKRAREKLLIHAIELTTTITTEAEGRI